MRYIIYKDGEKLMYVRNNPFQWIYDSCQGNFENIERFKVQAISNERFTKESRGRVSTRKLTKTNNEPKFVANEDVLKKYFPYIDLTKACPLVLGLKWNDCTEEEKEDCESCMREYLSQEYKELEI